MSCVYNDEKKELGALKYMTKQHISMTCFLIIGMFTVNFESQWYSTS